jgi:hypothetical protein
MMKRPIAAPETQKQAYFGEKYDAGEHAWDFVCTLGVSLRMNSYLAKIMLILLLFKFFQKYLILSNKCTS